jgi:hypothetical protein
MIGDSNKCESVRTAPTPEIIEHSDSVAVTGGREQLVAEILDLKRTIEDLTERREEDRKSILILQSQIDRMRGGECSDSLESSFKIITNVASYLWKKVPSVPLASVLTNFGPPGKKRSKKNPFGRSSRTSSVNSPKIPEAIFKTSRYVTKE